MANVNQATNNLSSTLNGASNFLGNVSNGNGGNMLGNFFSNLANGKVSGMSIAGTVAGTFWYSAVRMGSARLPVPS